LIPIAGANTKNIGDVVAVEVSRLLPRLWPWLAAVTSGLLAAAAFPPFDQTWLVWIALVPLSAAILFQSKAVRRPWLLDLMLGYVAGLAFFWACFFWMTTVSVLGWFVLQFYLALYFAAWSWFCGLMRPRVRQIVARDKWSEMLARARPPETAQTGSPWLSSGHNLFLALSLATGWVGLEWIRGWMFSGFGWNGLGVALHATWPLIQIAEFTGVAGVTFLAAFSNIILTTTARRIWEETRAHAMRPHFDLTLTLVGLVAAFTWGLTAVQTRPTSRPLRVALIQASVPRAEKFDVRYKQTIFDKFARLSKIALTSGPRINLMVWPESSMPAPVLEDQETFDFVSQIASSNKVDLLLGAIDEGPHQVYNAALLFPSEGDPQLYRKVHLVPFGEYVPFRHSFPLFAKIVGDQVPEDFDAGKEFTVFQLSDNRGKVAPLICFEDTVGELTRQFALGGADFFANVTNDGWFLHSAGSRQHLANAIFRCVENRRPMVRAANTGVTCLVNEFGSVTQVLRDDQGSIFEEGTLIGEINIATEPKLTFYAQHGELFAKVCAGFATLILILKLSIQLLMRRKTKSVVTPP
jgi:apolipoprotein N-acyltransferase